MHIAICVKDFLQYNLKFLKEFLKYMFCPSNNAFNNLDSPVCQ